ncbi:DHH family phosphoesterase [Methanobrevibacter sp. DSM 116169]|uniref:DHH family phosphoesterase n=1 Tax=Methanobrevibacter sp. DSM 116169 TaxID=3242727 RepID=UPI0038FD003C
MKKDCTQCKGTGSETIDYKECDSCGGTGFKDFVEVGNHFKNANNNAKAKFDLETDQDIPCDNCNGKGQVPIKEDCSYCNGEGNINVCRKCGKVIDPKYDYCRDCHIKMKDEKMKEEEKAKKENEPKTVYKIDPLCEMKDMEKEKFYIGKVTRVEKYGVFVTLNNNVWGLMRGDTNHNVGDEVVVKVSAVKLKERQIDLVPANVKNYNIETLTKEIDRTKIDELEVVKSKVVKIIGEVLQIQQTSGPTIFTITDETSITWVAAFDEAGVRAYPEVEIGDVIEVLGEVNQHGGKTQIESQSITKLLNDDSKYMLNLIEEALNEKAEPPEVDFFVKSDVLNKLKPKMREAAKTIRKAILQGRSILIRHHADADGICAGVAMEKAVLPLIDEVNPSNDAIWHYFKRSPSKAPFYELEDVVKDLSYALEDLERHGQKLPLIVLLDNGSTEEDVVSLMQAKIYDIEVVVIDHHFPGEVIDGKVEVDEYVDTHVNPYLVGGDSQLTAGALSTEVARIINPDVSETIKHLPAIASLGDHAESGEVYQYVEIAEKKGFNKDELLKIAECVDFEAYFLRFMNGRGIMDTILAVDNLDKHEKMINALFKEYKKRVDNQLKAALPNISQRTLDNGIIFNELDVEKYAHKFTFPAPGKTCGFVHDKIAKQVGEDKPVLTLAYGPDFGVIRATEAVNEIFGFNLNEIIQTLIVKIPEAGIDGGGHECAGSLKYIEGLSKEVLNDFVLEIASMKKSN